MAVKASVTITLSKYRDTESMTRYYKLQSSTASAPAKPTAKPPSGWTDAEPSYTSGSTNTLYFVDLTVFSDGTWSYSTVSKSSSYEAAKEAYNKAQNAQDTANNAQEDIDNLEIGGRNLFRYEGCDENEYQLPDYNDVGSFKQFFDCLTFDPAETVGETYTISLWAKSPNGATQLRVYNSNGNPRYFYFSSKTLTTALTTEWQKYSVTITNAEYASYTESTNYNRIEIYAPNQKGVLVKKIKIEVGDKATDWTPAIEDTREDISNAQGTADSAISRIGTAEVEIDTINDIIRNLVVDENNASLMTQVGDRWVFSTSNIEGSIESVKTALSELTTKLGDTDAVVNILKQTVTDHGAELDYVTIGTYEGSPSIELGETDSEHKLIITNKVIAFKVGSHVPTHIDTTGAITDNVTIKYDLVQNYFKWGTRESGNYGLSWIGGRNLLLNSKAEQTIPGGTNWRKAEYTLAESIANIGETYTLFVEFTPGTGLTSLRLNNEKSELFTTSHSVVVDGTGKQSATITFTTTNTASSIRLYAMPNDGSQTGSTIIHKAKLEIGSMATAWSPAIEDVG